MIYQALIMTTVQSFCLKLGVLTCQMLQLCPVHYAVNSTTAGPVYAWW
jgi:hypothetical protein